MESLGLAAVVAGLSPLRGGAVQIPKYTPPRVEKPRRFPQCDVFLPSYLIQEGLCCFLCPHVKKILVHIERELFSGLAV